MSVGRVDDLWVMVGVVVEVVELWMVERCGGLT